MIIETLQFLIKTLSDLFVLVLLLRFYLQVAHAPFRHPLCQFVMGVTNFVVVPARRMIPSFKSYDVATLLVAWLVGLATDAMILALNPVPYNFAAPQTWLALALLGVLYLFKQSLYLLMGAVIVQAVMSWINPYNPLAPLLDSLTRPYLQPFRRAVISGVDLSPIILFLIIQVILMLPVRLLEANLLMQLKILM
jgi:YggT family protein